MDEQKIFNTIKELYVKLPKFEDGRIDYSNSSVAPVVTIFIKYKNNILLLKRSDKVMNYKEKWNTIAGYLDELKPVKDKILEEVSEELGINENGILSIKLGESYKFTDNKINKTWIICPVLILLKEKINIKLDWEHTEYKWIEPDEVKNFDTVPNLEESLFKILN